MTVRRFYVDTHGNVVADKNGDFVHVADHLQEVSKLPYDKNSAYLVSHKRLKDIAGYKSVVTYYEINTILERLYADKDVCQITVHALIPVELNIKTVATMPF